MNVENPNAFPYGYGTDKYERAELGMTLRDYFAAKVLHGIVQRVESNDFLMLEDEQKIKDSIASQCYSYADAMLRSRAKEN